MNDPANANLEPIPARLKIGRNTYGQFYVSAIEGGYLWGEADGPTYIRADLYEAALENATRRELKLRRELARLTAKESTQ